MSLPSRERGLKSKIWKKAVWFKHVAPLAGAWIEIEKYQSRKERTLVAPLAGAWIEIADRAEEKQDVSVAPLAGAWIEMEMTLAIAKHKPSLPSRERGLKLDV